MKAVDDLLVSDSFTVHSNSQLAALKIAALLGVCGCVD